MEYLDYYDEKGNYIGKETRENVHKNALWHKTVHCWLYDKEGNIYFQIRKDLNKLYTTASGHIKAGETVAQGFAREINEELGIKIDQNKIKFMDTFPFKLDRIEKDGSVFRDRAFANIYLSEYSGTGNDFNCDTNEVLGIVKLNAKDTLDLIENKKQNIFGTIYKSTPSGVEVSTKDDITLNNFLVNNGETAIGKYGSVLNKVIDITTK